ncbi:MAG TPA: biopolymer transporter ExbD [Paludibacter sp.]|nr:biopolymer transporter ExbD [Paludibacter sp.]
MAEIQSNEGGGKKKKGGSKQKKMSVHVDFTPMVDMNMLLITFFMLCTSLSKPQTMEINMPTNKDTDVKNSTAVKESEAITVLLTGGDSIFYYEGLPKFKDYTSLKQTSYKPDGLRAYLLKRNIDVVTKINDLKQKKLELKISEKDYKDQVSKLKNGKGTPTVVIKATDSANYKNLIDALDEMSICNIGKYAIVKIDKADNFLLKNRETKGVYATQFAN